MSDDDGDPETPPIPTYDDPDVWLDPLDVTVWEFTIYCGYIETWRPLLDLPTAFRAQIEPPADHSGQSMAGHITFWLGASTEPGYCLNRTRTSEPEPHWTDTGPDDEDLKFPPEQAGFDIFFEDSGAWTTESVIETTITVMCLDYGAHGSIAAEIENEQGIMAPARLLTDEGLYQYEVNGETFYREYAPIPWDEDENYIADVWMRNYGNAMDDEEDEGECPVKGDGFTRYEEYRGFSVNGGWTELDPDAHKDVFVIDGNVPSLGIGSFADLGVTPHVFNTPQAQGEFLADCTINFNHGTGHNHLQRGIWVYKKELPWPDVCGHTPTKLNNPYTRCHIDDDEILRKYKQARHLQARAAVISHELGTACNLEHCATQQCFMRANPWNAPDPLPTLYCEAPCKHAYRLY